MSPIKVISSLIHFITLLFLGSYSVQMVAGENRYVSTSLASDEILFDLLSEMRLREIVGLSTLVDNPNYSNIVSKTKVHKFQRVSSKGVERKILFGFKITDTVPIGGWRVNFVLVDPINKFFRRAITRKKLHAIAKIL